MGYTHGTQWSDERIVYEIRQVISTLNINYFPTKKEMDKTTKSTALSNKVYKSGGSKKWATRLNIPLKSSDTNFGRDNEFDDIEVLIKRGYKVFKTPPNHSYDFVLNGSIRVNSKISNLYHGNKGNFFSFNLEKKYHDCDLFILKCIYDDGSKKVLIIPSSHVYNIGQLSIGEINSKYYKYEDRFDYIDTYTDFYNEIRCS